MPPGGRKRYMGPAKPGGKELGPLANLPGTWANEPGMPGRGWNMIALPFATEPKSPFNYRLLLNQYNEELVFAFVDDNVPNRGIRRNGVTVNADQHVVTLDYQQTINQIAAEDFPKSGLAGDSGAAIHHEPGLWLHMKDETTNDIDIARLGSIPHGDAVLALGKSSESKGESKIPATNGLPIGVAPLVDESRYLEPYKYFRDNPFKGLFDPTKPHELLRKANEGVDIVKTTTLEVSTTVETGGIRNIPFIVKQANAADMKSTFWIQEVKEKGKTKYRLQYLQIVMLDFFPRRDDFFKCPDRFPECCDDAPDLIRWPHVSINTMEKVD